MPDIDPARATLLERYDDVIAALGEHPGSLAAALTDGGDAQALATEAALPPSLAVLLDRLAGALFQVWFDDEKAPRRAAAATAIRRWFARPLDRDVAARLPAAIATRLLEDAARRSDLAAAQPALDAQRRSLAALNTRAAAGEPVARTEWAAVRNATVALTDGLPRGPLRWTGMAIEAAAWNPATSAVILSDLLRPLNELRNRAASAATGWTDADATRAEATLERILAEAKARGEADGQVDVPTLFTAADPDLQARFADQINAGSRATFDFYQEILDMVADAIEMLPPPLIPRARLFGNPARVGNAISPDGRWLTWHAPRDGVMNLWIAPREAPADARALTADTGRGVRGHMWAYDNRHILYTQDRDGDERAQVYALDIESGTVRALTDDPEAMFMLAQVSRHHPGKLLVASNERDRRYHDLVLFDIATGAREMAQQNDGYAFFVTDDHFRAVLASKSLPDGSRTLSRRAADGGWEEWMAFGPEDAATSGPAGLSADGRTLYLSDSRDREATALYAVDMASGDRHLIAADPRGPVGIAMVDIDSYEPLAWAITVERRELHVLDDRFAKDVARFEGMGWADWGIASRTLDDRFWIVGTSSDVNPGSAWLYDRDADTLDKLADGRPDLADAPLARMRHFTITSRDGLPLVCYLTIPIEGDATGDDERPAARAPLPMVLEVHGGPAMRDGFGFNAQHQWLANRGYAVLSVNFRGSAGFSKSFLAAGDGEWGAKMSDDLDDAVAWAVAQGIADPARVAISGASYGGYAVLAALTRSPEKYACGIDLVGPSNLETLMAAIPPYWESHRASLYKKVGDPGTEEGLALLRDRSPLHRAAAIRRPLLIGQGANDPRVLKQEADQMAAAMQANGVPVTYLLYPDEGHGFGRPPNAVSFSAMSEAFLARHLGGRCEPLAEGETAGAKVKVMAQEPWVDGMLPTEIQTTDPA